MLTVYNCITVDHDLRLVILAGFICVFATFSATHLLVRSTEEGEQRRAIWVLGAGIVAGCGIWATHFIAMLAFRVEDPVSYDPGVTFLSFVIAIVFAWACISAFVEPFVIAAMMQVYFRTIAGQVPDPEWDRRLAEKSKQFRELKDKALASVGGSRWGASTS